MIYGEACFGRRTTYAMSAATTIVATAMPA